MAIFHSRHFAPSCGFHLKRVPPSSASYLKCFKTLWRETFLGQTFDAILILNWMLNVVVVVVVVVVGSLCTFGETILNFSNWPLNRWSADSMIQFSKPLLKLMIQIIRFVWFTNVEKWRKSDGKDPGFLFIHFRSFKTNKTIFRTNHCEKCPSSI